MHVWPGQLPITNTENVYLLGAGDRLVANTSYCVHPEEVERNTEGERQNRE